MAVVLIAVLVALTLGHLAPELGRLRRYGWIGHWLDWLATRPKLGRLWRGEGGLLLSLAPPLLIVLLVQTLLGGSLYGLAAFLFAVALLFYCWGPRDLDVDVEAIRQAPDQAARRAAAQALSPHAGRVDIPLQGSALIHAVFSAAIRRWFGVLFWFLLLGPLGAALYRLTQLLAEAQPANGPLPLAQTNAAQRLLAILDWPVAHLMTLALALVADFDAVRVAWQQWHHDRGSWFALDNGFLLAAARASVASTREDHEEEEIEGVPPELGEAMRRVWRILIVWLTVLALLVLAGWVA
ncbi:MAG TPA: cobalamin biosynthesis protein [Xanthomonadaceae bacterium]|nr:cobalamin biosynthesis protein [Xanthomonadaceae bacterium]